MNDGQYTNLRNYLEEIASQNKQLLEAVHEIRLAANRIDGRVKGQEPAKFVSVTDTESAPKVPKEAVGPVTVETVETVDSGKKDAPAVPRRQDAPVEGLAAMETMTAPKTTTAKKGK